MNTKLTLKIDEQAIEIAKKYASDNNKSLSSIVESFFRALKKGSAKKEDTIEISDFVKSLSIQSGLPADLDYKKELGDYYAEKYK